MLDLYTNLYLNITHGKAPQWGPVAVCTPEGGTFLSKTALRASQKKTASQTCSPELCKVMALSHICIKNASLPNAYYIIVRANASLPLLRW